MTVKKTQTIKLNFKSNFTLEELREFVKSTESIDGTATVSIQQSSYYPGEGTSTGYLSVTGDL